MDSIFLFIIGTVVIGTLLYAYFPRRCKSCKNIMKIKHIDEKIIHVCEKCRIKKDTGIGVADNIG